MTRADSHQSEWDHSSNSEFVEYYAKESESENTTRRFASAYKTILHVRTKMGRRTENLSMADIGCGTGNQAFIWANAGHAAHGLDVNQPLVELARERAQKQNLKIDYQLGAASNLPWPDESMDVCSALELLEHIDDWQGCIQEFSRVLKKDGILCLSTTNKLCPIQQEFHLPLYSWYPGRVKRYVEHLARTTRPQLANYATYPAVNWFSFYSLKKHLQKMGYKVLDKFDCADSRGQSDLRRFVLAVIRRVPLIRFLAHCATPGSFVMAIKENTRTA